MKKFTFDVASAKIPRWAGLERELLHIMNRAVDVIPAKYLNPDGTSKWPNYPPEKGSVGSADDVYESFHSWPLCYVLGGDDKFLEMSKREFDAVTEQLHRYSESSDLGKEAIPVIDEDFFSHGDWMHIGESMEFFYVMNLADPEDEKNRERAVRFANYYFNEGPNITEPNYDFEHKVIRSSATGSHGARFSDPEKARFGYHNPSWLDFYNLPFHDIEGVKYHEDLEDPEKAHLLGEAVARRQQRSDSPTNLLATSLMTNAYLNTGDERYRQWVIDYTEAWRERTAQNGGVLPDNCGPTGKVGELMDGKWYGGYYGWTFPHGFTFLAEGLAVSGQNECLLTGDTGKLSWVREQTEELMKYGVEHDGVLYLPYKYAAPGSDIQYRPMGHPSGYTRDSYREDYVKYIQVDGRFEFVTLGPNCLTHSWHMTFDPRDLEVLRKTQGKGEKSLGQIDRRAVWHPDSFPDGYASYGGPGTKNLGAQERALMGYHTGIFPDYPEKMLEYNIDLVFDRLKTLREDTQPEEKYTDDYLQLRNPIVCEGLVHLTMGGPLPLYNGGLLVVSLFYFDADRGRPGLPEDVAALVSEVRADGLTVTLVNLSPLDTRNIIVQGGAFGEHEFTSAEITQADGKTFREALEGSRFAAELCPGSVTTLRLSMKRYANDPRLHTAKA